MKFRFKGLNEYVRKLEKVADLATEKIHLEKAVTEGASVVADETRKALDGLPVDNRPYVEGMRDGILQVQKTALIKSFGITETHESRNKIDRKTGVNKGTNKLGQPNVTIARRLENGTSYMKKNKVFSRSSTKARSACLDAMEKSINDSIRKIINS